MSLEVLGGVVGESVLRSEEWMLAVVAHWDEVVVRGLGQVVVESASNVHRKPDAMSRIVKLEELIVVVRLWLRSRGGRSGRGMLSIVLFLLLGFLRVMGLFLFSFLGIVSFLLLCFFGIVA